MKKFLSMILALAMIVSVVSICGGSASAAKALPEGVLYHWGFENDSDLIAVEHINQKIDGKGVITYEIVPANRKPDLAVNQGVYGSALYLDGTYGVKLKDLEKMDLDAYTISFWMLDCESNYNPPIVQLGSNMADDSQQGATKSMKFYTITDSETGTTRTIVPQVDMYDSSKGTVEVPGMFVAMQPSLEAAFPSKQWKLITLVVDGEEFVGMDQEKHVGSKLYVDGKLVVDASAETESMNAVIPGLLDDDAVEGLLGINYHDSYYFTGYLDEMYIFDRALSEESVQKVLAAGDPSIVPTATVKVNPPTITKNPTSESVNEGGNAYFVARAENYNYINWYIVSPDHTTRIPVTSAPWSFTGLSYSGEGTTTLLLSNCPLSLNGWCVEATFTGEGGSSTSSHCPIYVNKAAKVQLFASPSSGYFEYSDQGIQLNAGPNDSIYYELYLNNRTQTGTIKSGEYIYIPAIADIRYDAYLYAYVVGDQNNAISCQYTMDCLPVTPVDPTTPDPDVPGGHYSSNELALDLTPAEFGTFTATLSIYNLTTMEGTARDGGGTIWLSLADPNGTFLGGYYENGTIEITTSDWDLLPVGTTFYNVW